MKDKTIDYLLRTTWLSVQKMYNEEAAKFGSTMATGFTLLSIDPENGTPSTSLGPKMGMEPTSLSRLLNAMEKRELIIRSKNPNDGRSVLIHLTPFGRQKREDSKAVVLNFNEELNNKLSTQKVKHFFEVIEGIRETTLRFEYFKEDTLKQI